MEVEHEQAKNRFVIRLEEGEAELAYLEGGQVLDLTHTFVPPENRGQGVGEALVEHAFSYAREHGYRVRPSCPFVKAWLEGHPEQRSVVA